MLTYIYEKILHSYGYCSGGGILAGGVKDLVPDNRLRRIQQHPVKLGYVLHMHVGAPLIAPINFDNTIEERLLREDINDGIQPHARRGSAAGGGADSHASQSRLP